MSNVWSESEEKAILKEQAEVAEAKGEDMPGPTTLEDVEEIEANRPEIPGQPTPGPEAATVGEEAAEASEPSSEPAPVEAEPQVPEASPAPEEPVQG